MSTSALLCWCKHQLLFQLKRHILLFTANMVRPKPIISAISGEITFSLISVNIKSYALHKKKLFLFLYIYKKWHGALVYL